MAIFFDGQTFGMQRQGGISRLFFELTRCLGGRPEITQSLYRGLYLDTYPFSSGWFQDFWGMRRPLARGYRITDPLEQAWVEACYHRSARRNPKSIYHASYYRLPAKPAGPLVVQVYDMIHERYGGDPATIERKRKAITSADLIIAISRATAEEVSAMLSVPVDRIRVAYPGVSPVFLDERESAATPGDLGVPRPYVLYVGQRGWYKNFNLLLRTFAAHGFYKDLDLVAVGGSDKPTAEERTVINSAQKGNWLRLLQCNDRQLACLYRGAFAYVCPSQQEGFGIPLVEAMAGGCPVIAAAASSLPEVVGDAGLLFPSNDPEALAEALIKLRDDNQFRAELRRRGTERAQGFTWEKMADTIVRGYEEL